MTNFNKPQYIITLKGIKAFISGAFGAMLFSMYHMQVNDITHRINNTNIKNQQIFDRDYIKLQQPSNLEQNDHGDYTVKYQQQIDKLNESYKKDIEQLKLKSK